MPERSARAYLRDLPEAQFHLLDGGHWARETNLDDVVRLSRQFLERCSLLEMITAGAKTMNANSGMARARIARIWRGRTTRANADAYEPYLYEEGIKPLQQKALGVELLREDRATESEFVTISYWESVEAMSGFTGGDPNKIHHLDRDAEFLIELPEGVQILKIIVPRGHSRPGNETVRQQE